MKILGNKNSLLRKEITVPEKVRKLRLSQFLGKFFRLIFMLIRLLLPFILIAVWIGLYILLHRALSFKEIPEDIVNQIMKHIPFSCLLAAIPASIITVWMSRAFPKRFMHLLGIIYGLLVQIPRIASEERWATGNKIMVMALSFLFGMHEIPQDIANKILKDQDILQLSWLLLLASCSCSTIITYYVLQFLEIRKEIDKVSRREFLMAFKRFAFYTLGLTLAVALLVFVIGYAKIRQKGYLDDKLLQAAFHSRPVHVKVLIKLGANVNAKDVDGSTPLMNAVCGNQLSLVRLLLESGADVNAKDIRGETPLLTAAGWRQSDVALALLNAGADVNATSNKGVTPLMRAAARNRTRTVNALLDKGADINARSNDGKTALILAAEQRATSSVKALLARGADVKAKTNDGETALKIAASKSHKGIVQLLEDTGAKE